MPIFTMIPTEYIVMYHDIIHFKYLNLVAPSLKINSSISQLVQKHQTC